MFVFFLQKYLEEEVLKYKNILRKMKDYDENISKEKIAKAYAEKEKRRLEVSYFSSNFIFLLGDMIMVRCINIPVFHFTETIYLLMFWGKDKGAELLFLVFISLLLHSSLLNWSVKFG